MCKKLIVVLLSGMVLGMASLVFGQAGASTAALKGLIADPQGAVVSGATIIVTDAAGPFAIDLVNDHPIRIDPPSNRQQYGGTLSFPLKRDRGLRR